MATALQKRVWSKLKEIPKGHVTTYKELAKAVESRAVRAVATAVGKNPNAPSVPCHRVVLSSGAIGNYTHPLGAARKIELLESEGVAIENNRVVNFEKVFYKFK